MALRGMLGMPQAAQPVQAAVIAKPSRWSGPRLACALGTTRVLTHATHLGPTICKKNTPQDCDPGCISAKIGWLCQTAVAPHESAHRIQVEFQPHGILHYFHLNTKAQMFTLLLCLCIGFLLYV